MNPLETARRITLFGLMIVLFAFKVSASGAGPTTKQGGQDHEFTKLNWAEVIHPGLELKMKSKSQVRYYFFHSDKTVSTTLGTIGTNKRTGYISAPIFLWEFSGRWLQILETDGKLLYQMRLLKVGENEITVDNGSGGTEVFEMWRNDKPPQTVAPDRKP